MVETLRLLPQQPTQLQTHTGCCCANSLGAADFYQPVRDGHVILAQRTKHTKSRSKMRQGTGTRYSESGLGLYKLYVYK